ncbi:MAG: carboxylesterase family protein [Asticcacaulis sp.]
MINRRHILGAGAAALVMSHAARAQSLSHSTIPAAPFVEVETASGKVRGGTERGAVVFKGIPYAGSVGGANRFKAPPPVEAWTGVFDATRLGPPSLQTPKSTYGENEPAYSEDCLVLNVWTPPGFRSGKRPVMVYLHGGGYSTGSAGSTTQDGARLAAVYDVVVVAPNHRLGLLGFLYLGDMPGGDYAAANPSMLDIVASLQWVRDNIAAFGGDAENVTVFGESGGGAKVGTLLGMPAAKGLFHKAGIQSGAQLKRMPKAVAHETAKRLFKALDIPDAQALRDVPAQRLLELQWAGERGAGPLAQPTQGYVSAPRSPLMDISFSESTLAGHFAPVIDGAVLPNDPFDPVATPLCADIPLLIGSNKTEASFFNRDNPEIFDMTEDALKARLQTEFGDRADEILRVYRPLRPKATPSELYLAIATARTMGHETVILAGLKSQQPAPVYAYRWDYDNNVPIAGTSHTLGAGHATDIGPTFYNWDQQGLHGNGPGVEAASRHLSAIWTGFARNGVPSAKGLPQWPRYDTRTRATLLVDVTCRLVNDPDSAARQMWDS